MPPSRPAFPVASLYRRIKARVATYRRGWFRGVVWFLFGAMTVLLFPAMVAVWLWRLSYRPSPRGGRRVSMVLLMLLAWVLQLLWLNALVIDPMAGIGEALNQPTPSSDGPVAADIRSADEDPSTPTTGEQQTPIQSDDPAENNEVASAESITPAAADVTGDADSAAPPPTTSATPSTAAPTTPAAALPETTTGATVTSTTAAGVATTAPTLTTTTSITTPSATTTTTTAPATTTTTTLPAATTTTAPPPTTTSATAPPTNQPTAGTNRVLSGLAVGAESSGGVAYDRDLYGSWRSVRSGCNTRCAVLEEEQRADGTWLSWFDGVVTSNSSDLDIDHMVPLAEAHSSGAWQWSSSRRRDFANDLANPEALTAVSASSNRSKGARDPAEWRPPQQRAWCQYATDWITVKIAWGLTADQAEVRALEQMLDTCGSEVAIVTVTATTLATTTTTVAALSSGGSCPYTSQAGDPCAAVPALGNRSNDVNCGDIPSRFKPLTVVGQDYDRLDGNNDGAACTS